MVTWPILVNVYIEKLVERMRYKGYNILYYEVDMIGITSSTSKLMTVQHLKQYHQMNINLRKILDESKRNNTILRRIFNHHWISEIRLWFVFYLYMK
jgi:hypothetical protein